MDLFFENLIIETYGQLMGVVLALALAVIIFRLMRLKSVARRKRTALPLSTPLKAAVVPAPPGKGIADTPTQRLRAADQREFDRLAQMISTVSLRAEHVTETQCKAALKLDTVEMAMHRLLLDVDGLVKRPRSVAPPLAFAAVAAPTRATLAA